MEGGRRRSSLPVEWDLVNAQLQRLTAQRAVMHAQPHYDYFQSRVEAYRHRLREIRSKREYEFSLKRPTPELSQHFTKLEEKCRQQLEIETGMRNSVEGTLQMRQGVLSKKRAEEEACKVNVRNTTYGVKDDHFAKAWLRRMEKTFPSGEPKRTSAARIAANKQQCDSLLSAPRLPKRIAPMATASPLPAVHRRALHEAVAAKTLSTTDRHSAYVAQQASIAKLSQSKRH